MSMTKYTQHSQLGIMESLKSQTGGLRLSGLMHAVHRQKSSPPPQPSPFKGEGRKRVRYPIFVLISLFVLTGCGTPKAGLQAQYPPVKKGMFALWGEFIEVDFLQPTLRWQPFPRQEDRDADQGGFLSRIEDVTYELRIWKTITASSGQMVYSRENLRLPYHKLEEPLEPSTKYLWSVRAHFMRDGQPRTIEWGLAGYLLRGEVVPNPSCFRFKTPP
jgi:hypothetical protein